MIRINFWDLCHEPLGDRDLTQYCRTSTTRCGSMNSPVTMDSFSKINIPVVLFLCACLGLLTLQLCRTWWRLRHIPGPFPACITNFQRMRWIGTKRAHLILQQMHENYGEVVRIGPNMVSFSNPEAITTVYPMRPGFPKVRTYNLAPVGLYARLD